MNQNKLKILLILWLFATSALAALDAQVDRTQVSMGETFELTVIAKGKKPSGAPKTDVLEQDFQILGTRQGSQIQIINGQRSSEYQWIYTLVPRKTGDLQIPSIPLDNESTQPISIRVSPRAGNNASTSQEPLQLQVSLEQQELLVQSEGILKLKFIHTVPVAELPRVDLNIPDMVISAHGEPKTYHRQEGNTVFGVAEYTYSIFPQKSGEFFVPALTMTVNVPLRGSQFGFLQHYETLEVQSEPVAFKVNPRPESFKGNWWLPANALKLSQSWSKPLDNWVAGEALTRTVRIEAVGLTAEQLPELELNLPEELRGYLDQPQRKTELRAGQSVATLEQKFAIIPTRGGNFTLPPIAVRWWNVATNQEEVAYLNEIQVTVGEGAAPASSGTEGQSATATPPSATSSDAAQDGELDTAPSAVTAWQSNPWFWLFIAAMLAWITTLLLLFLRWRSTGAGNRSAVGENRDAPNAAMIKPELRLLRDACNQSQPKAARTSLVRIAALLFGHCSNLTQLQELLRKTQATDLEKALADLDAALYSQNPEQWNGQQFFEMSRQWAEESIKKSKKNASKRQGELPELYFS